jgi:hypothetical protein
VGAWLIVVKKTKFHTRNITDRIPSLIAEPDGHIVEYCHKGHREPDISEENIFSFFRDEQ